MKLFKNHPIEISQYQKELLAKHSHGWKFYLSMYLLSIFTIASLVGWVIYQGTILGNICMFFLVIYVMVQWLGMGAALIAWVSLWLLDFTIKIIREEIYKDGYVDEKEREMLNKKDEAIIKILPMCRPFPSTAGRINYRVSLFTGWTMDIGVVVCAVLFGAPILAVMMFPAFVAYFIEARVRYKGWELLQTVEPPEDVKHETTDELCDKLFHG